MTTAPTFENFYQADFWWRSLSSSSTARERGGASELTEGNGRSAVRGREGGSTVVACDIAVLGRDDAGHAIAVGAEDLAPLYTRCSLMRHTLLAILLEGRGRAYLCVTSTFVGLTEGKGLAFDVPGTSWPHTPS